MKKIVVLLILSSTGFSIFAQLHPLAASNKEFRQTQYVKQWAHLDTTLDIIAEPDKYDTAMLPFSSLQARGAWISIITCNPAITRKLSKEGKNIIYSWEGVSGMVYYDKRIHCWRVSKITNKKIKKLKPDEKHFFSPKVKSSPCTRRSFSFVVYSAHYKLDIFYEKSNY